MARKVEVSLDEILDLINAAEDYGFSDDVLLGAFADWIGWVSNDEITSFATNVYLSDSAKDQGYTREDYTQAVERVKTWRNQYCKRSNRKSGIQK